ncbi:MAG: DUF4209 domain-containing protein, partial [Candidatus Limnocylindria bacterium]
PEPDRITYPEDFGRARDIAWVSRQAIFTAGITELVIDELRKRGTWTAPNLTAVIAAVDEELAEASATGFVRYEAGDAWSAVHILAPQVEHAMRVLGIEVGARVTGYTPHEGMRWVSMNSLLEAPEVRGALGDDLALNIEALFVEGYGQNIRNNVAHGAFSYPGNDKNAATLCILTLLSLGAVVLRERARRRDDPEPADPANV